MTSRRDFLAAAAGAGAALGLPAAARAQHDLRLDGPPLALPPRLRILVLGGTGQTGPHFIARALAHGHEVTMFNRGRRGADLFPDVELIVGDRDPAQADGLAALAAAVASGRRWDVVLDVWPHVPKFVETTATLLRDAAERYMFVSSMSVYADSSQPDQDETAAVGEAPDADSTEFTMELFGPFKAECENRVRRIFAGRHAIFRPGLIVGPRDGSFRGGYWPVRVRRGGTVVAPGDGETRIQQIDGRDLAAFELLCMERGIGGTFNVVGPHPRRPLTMRRLLETCRTVSKSDAEFEWIPGDFLAEHGVGPWMQMPCWLPTDGEYAGFGSRRIDRALAAGLVLRPLAETIEDTLQWYDGLSDEQRAGLEKRAGISAETETAVLSAWRARADG